MNCRKDNSRATSEVIGYILIIGIVISVISISFFVGQVIVERNVEANHAQNTLQNMILFNQRSMNTLTDSREGFTQGFNHEGGQSISIENLNQSIEISGKSESFNSLIYSALDYEIKLTMTGIVRREFRTEQTNSIVISDPKWTVTDDSIIVNLIEYNTPSEDLTQTDSINIEVVQKSVEKVHSGTGDDFRLDLQNKDAWLDNIREIEEYDSVNSVSFDSTTEEIVVEVDSSSTVVVRKGVLDLSPK